MPHDEIKYLSTDHTRTEEEVLIEAHQKPRSLSLSSFSCNGSPSAYSRTGHSSPSQLVVLLPRIVSPSPLPDNPFHHFVPDESEGRESVSTASLSHFSRKDKQEMVMAYDLYEGLPHCGHDEPACYMIPVPTFHRDVQPSAPTLLELQAQGPPEGFAQTFFVGDDRVIPQNATLIASPVDLHFILMRVLFDGYVVRQCCTSSSRKLGVGHSLVHSVSSRENGLRSAEVKRATTKERKESEEEDERLDQLSREEVVSSFYAPSFKSAQEWLFPLPLSTTTVHYTTSSTTTGIAALPFPPGVHETEAVTSWQPHGEMEHPPPVGLPTGTHSSYQKPFGYSTSSVSTDERWPTADEGEIYEDGESFFQQIRKSAGRQKSPVTSAAMLKKPFPEYKREREEEGENEDPRQEQLGKKNVWTEKRGIHEKQKDSSTHYSSSCELSATSCARLDSPSDGMGWWERWNRVMRNTTSMADASLFPLLPDRKGLSENCHLPRRDCLQRCLQDGLPPLLEDFCETKKFMTNTTSMLSHASSFASFSTTLEEKEITRSKGEGRSSVEGVTYYKPSLVKAAMWLAQRVQRVQRSTALRNALQVPVVSQYAFGLHKEEGGKADSGVAENNENKYDDDGGNCVNVNDANNDEEVRMVDPYDNALREAALELVAEYVPSTLLMCMREALKEMINKEERVEGHARERMIDNTMSQGVLAHQTTPLREKVWDTTIKSKTSMSYAQCLAILEGTQNVDHDTKLGWKNSAALQRNFSFFQETKERQRNYFGQSHEKGEDRRNIQQAKQKVTTVPVLSSLRRLEKDGKPQGTPTLDFFFGAFSTSGKGKKN